MVDDTDTKLAQCRIDTPAEMYLSRCLGYGAITGVSLWILTTVIVATIFTVLNPDIGTLIGFPVPNDRVLGIINLLKIPFLVTFTGIVFGAIGFAAGFYGPLFNLSLTSSGREREINMLLPDAVSFMYALSIGGMNQLEILEAISQADDVYGEVAREFQIVMHETTYFDIDYRTAIRKRSVETPSDNLAQFLTDMLSILSSGGDLTKFLDLKKNKHMRTAKQQQQETLETLELFGEMYMTLSLFPVLLIILLVSMSLMGGMDDKILYGAVYVLIPMVGVAFLVGISAVQQDDPGDGFLELADDDPKGGSKVSSRGAIDNFRDSEWGVMDAIREREGTMQAMKYLRYPPALFHEHPGYTLGITLPITIVIIANLIMNGMVPLSWDGLKSEPVWGTFAFFHIPLYLNGIPFVYFYEKRQRRRNGITSKLSDNLRKLSSANDTGQTLLDSFKTVSDTSQGKLATEFRAINAKVKYGISLKQALIEFNNKYHLPRMARTIKLIAESQEASSQITDVLSTAAQASENQDDLERERKTGARMQMVIIIMSFMTMLAVMALLKTQFLDTMGQLADSASGEGGGGGGGGASPSLGGVDIEKLALVFFHAVTLQGVTAGMISGYMRDGTLLSGVKYMLVLVSISLLVWMFV